MPTQLGLGSGLGSSRMSLEYKTERAIGGELYESVGVEAPILLSYTHKN